MQAVQQCPPAESLEGYLRGLLTDGEADRTEQHLESCSACRDRLEQLAGSSQLWREAKDLLQDISGGDATTGALAPKTFGEESELQHEGITGYLTQWLGPTDDPTKMGRVGPFEVVGIVGYGGAGVVLKAHDPRLNRFVAIKVLLPALAHNAAARKRFERESRAVAAIVHQNVVPIHVVDVYNGHPYLAMQYVSGASLQQRLDAHGPLQVIEIVRIAAQAARALAAAHAQGVVHRDIKPANILLESNVDRVLVADFGLARVIDDASRHSGLVAGTPQFMSPEQCQGHASDHRSDLFSLGSVMYAMCVGRPPFRAETLMGLLRKVCEAEPRRLREINPDVPEWLEAFIYLLLEKQPADRFQSAIEVAEILEAELAHLQNPTGVVAPNRDWMPPTNTDSIASFFPRRTLMILSATTLTAALFFAFAQLNDGAPNDSPSVPRANSEAAASPLVVSKGDDGETIYESKIEREFDVQPGGKLAIHESDADIAVVGSDSTKVRIVVVRRVLNASSEENATAMISRHDVKFDAKDNTVTARSEHKDASQENVDESAQFHVRYEVSVPSHFHAVLSTSDGDVSISDLVGDAEMNTSDGNVAARRITGNLSAITSDGNLDVESCEGRIVARTADGDATLANCKGTLAVETSDGNVAVENCDGASILAKTTDGNIKLKDCEGGTIMTSSEEGEVDIENCSGVFHTNTKQPLKSSGGASISF